MYTTCRLCLYFFTNSRRVTQRFYLSTKCTIAEIRSHLCARVTSDTDDKRKNYIYIYTNYYYFIIIITVFGRTRLRG